MITVTRKTSIFIGSFKRIKITVEIIENLLLKIMINHLMRVKIWKN